MKVSQRRKLTLLPKYVNFNGNVVKRRKTFTFIVINMSREAGSREEVTSSAYEFNFCVEKTQKQNGAKCANHNTFLDFFLSERSERVFDSMAAYNAIIICINFEPQSLGILKGTVRFFSWDILLVIELNNIFLVVPDYK